MTRMQLAAVEPETPAAFTNYVTAFREEATLLGALRRGELTLHYQPVASVWDGRVRMVEALLRWRHPARGLLTPDLFLPAVELTDAMREITAFVLGTAIRQAAEWSGPDAVEGVAVNLSATDLLDYQLPRRIGELLKAHGVAAHRLTIEITESAFISDPGRATVVLHALRAQGIRIALDDFGTGYSSLTHLQRLPVDAVKIDRCFVAAMADDDRSEAIVRSTIDLAHALGLTVVAEGVEHRAQWRRLEAARCDSAQGWFLARPLEAEDLKNQLLDIETRARSASILRSAR